MKIMTLNLRHDADRWPDRFGLVMQGVLAELPDIIGFQEVALAIEQAQTIARAVNGYLSERPYRVFVEEKWSPQPREGVAILTRDQVIESERIELPEAGRIAQSIVIQRCRNRIGIINTHLHHLPKDDESIRLIQTRHLLAWVADRSSEVTSWILVGDLNARPESETVKEVEKELVSAYKSVHGHEPSHTFPTPLVKEIGDWYQPRTLDYIFLTPWAFRATQACLTFTRPHPQDPTLYASDHYGILAEVGCAEAEDGPKSDRARTEVLTTQLMVRATAAPPANSGSDS
ncbi:MAG: endonuclease/exonuclease/phosphatase family protein [Chloroflexota bacterium]|nr:endonuclease/exonuclease/phosphatase family protein [Chloroflexota bacterium]